MPSAAILKTLISREIKLLEQTSKTNSVTYIIEYLSLLTTDDAELTVW